MKTNYFKPVTTATRHNGKVNHFAKIRQPHGKGFIFGFIDIATPHGLGFIYSVGDSTGKMWGGKILHASDEATLCTTPADLASAKASAKAYFENEEADLKAHLARCKRPKEAERIAGIIAMLAQIRRNAGV